MYHDWLGHYSKDMTNSDQVFGERFTIFKDKVRTIIEFNRDDSQSWKKGLNKFSDMTNKEFFRKYK